MKQPQRSPRLNLLVAPIVTAALLAACGGGQDATHSAALDFASRATPDAPRSSALAAPMPMPAAAPPSRAITNAELFAWAQATFPALFAGTPTTMQVPHEGKVFDVRAYPNGNFLGVANGVAYGLGAYTGGALVSFGAVQDYACTVMPSLCNGGGGGNGSLNECIDPASATPPTGFRVRLVYAYSGPMTGEQIAESVVDGPATFEGQTATLVTHTISGSNAITVEGIPVTTTLSMMLKSYQQAASNGLTRTLGSLDTITNTQGPITVGGVTIPGTTTTQSSKTVYNPPELNTEYTLSPGQSLDKTTTQTVTVLSGPMVPPPQTTTSTERYTYEARESISVQGKNYDTCRYKVSMSAEDPASTTWLLVGKGVMVRSRQTTEAGVQTIELKSGSYGGAPL